MAFKELNSLDAEVTISLGGINKKTRKANPTKVEGHYLGFRQVADKKKKSGISFIYYFATARGNVGVWGKTDLDRKMQSAVVGAMTRITQSGMRPTPNGDMYLYKVEVDEDNTVEVNCASETLGEDESESFSPEASEAEYDDVADAEEEGEEETDLDADEPAPDEVPPKRASAPKKVAALPDAARQEKVRALLNRNKASA